MNPYPFPIIHLQADGATSTYQAPARSGWDVWGHKPKPNLFSLEGEREPEKDNQNVDIFKVFFPSILKILYMLTGENVEYTEKMKKKTNIP